jgi:hypothetical protein
MPHCERISAEPAVANSRAKRRMTSGATPVMGPACSGPARASRSRNSENAVRTSVREPSARVTSARASSAGVTPFGSRRVRSSLPAEPGAQKGAASVSSQRAKTSSRPPGTTSASRRKRPSSLRISSGRSVCSTR